MFPDPKNPTQVVLFMIVAPLCFATSTRVVAILDFTNMAAPGVVRLGANRKSMVWATYVPNLVLLEESEPKIPNSPDYITNAYS